MIKLIAIDLDGTLYNSQHQLTERGREAIHKAKKNGLQPIIVTGRGRRGAENALAALGLDLPYICSAGALVRPGLEGETLYAWPYHVHEELLHVIQFTRETNTGLIVETPTGTPYWFGPDSMVDVMDPLTTKEAYKSIRTFAPEQDLDRPLLKATIVAESGLLHRAAEVVETYCPSIHYTFAGISYVDLTASGINKGTALKALADHFGLASTEIAAIGDQLIDLKMLQFAGLPIAMSNAVPQLKEAAKWIAPSNDEDGVAWAIDEIIKTQR